MRVLSGGDVATVLDLEALVPVVADAFRASADGTVERPDRPHYPVGEGLDGRETPCGTALAMPAYVHGAAHYATKLASVHPDNPARDRPTVQARIVLDAAATGDPVAIMAGTRITNARTACIGALAVRARHGDDEDGPAPTVALFGAGPQARWQARAIATVCPDVRFRVYSPNSRAACARALRERGLDATAVATPETAVTDAAVVVTATTATAPVFPADALAPTALVVAVGAYEADMQELPPTVFDDAALYADVPTEVAATGDAVAAGRGADAFAPVATLIDDPVPTDRRVIVLSVGSAVLDAAAATHVHERAVAADVGTTVDL